MAWELTDDVETFTAEAGEFLRSRPVEHTVLLTVVDRVRREGRHAYGPGDPVFGWWRTTEGTVDGLLVQTPPYPMGFSALPPEAVPAANDALASHRLTGVNMPTGAAEVFVPEWRRRTGGKATVLMHTRLYRLAELTPPDPLPPGGPRTAGPADRDLLVRWSAEFQDAIGESHREPSAEVDDWIAYGGVTLWEVAGVPVAMANRSRPAADMCRIRAVYTPREHRGQGFGGAATTTATRAALADGVRDVVLFTDLANPTSNGLYQRLGYRSVEDRTVVEFS